MKNPYMKVIILLLIITIIPFVLHAQDIGIDYSNSKFMNMDHKMLQNKLIGTNVETGLSVALFAGGITAIGLGGYAGIMSSVVLLIGGPWGIILGGVGVTGGLIACSIGYFAIEIANNSIRNLDDRRDKIKFALQQFEPVSYHDRPGVGIGISIPLNNN